MTIESLFPHGNTPAWMAGRFRIGELARRTGVSPALLRAWESRYGLLVPSRSAGGYRLYSEDDEKRVLTMRRHQAQGMSAAEAARLALEGDWAPYELPLATVDDSATELREALERYDEVEAQAALDRFLTTLSLDSVLAEVVLPCLRQIGERWERGEISVAQEHFAANLIRGRLLALARGWGQGRGPRALLACAPGELHDLGLISFGLALRARGWTITFLGPATPVETLGAAADLVAPELVVVSATTAERLEESADDLRALAAERPLALAGAGASEAFADAIGARFLGDDPVAEAERLSRASLV
jgi:MerR family transcriptional regulator, light-induced transcriptional regulator